MNAYAFSKLIPGGNPTLLLHDPDLAGRSLAELSARLMDPMHLFAEQAGALYVPQDGSLPRLAMMGGEFCVNATRAATMSLARRGCLVPLGDGAAADAASVVLGGRMEVSGASAPVAVLAARSSGTLADALQQQGDADIDSLIDEAQGREAASDPQRALLYCAARVDCNGAECAEVDAGVWLARIPGISHLLVDTAVHELPALDGSAWKTASARWRARYGLESEEASGVIWFSSSAGGSRIWPAVAVSATGTEHMESACGSASLALALAKGAALTVLQPSGERLEVLPESSPSCNGFARVWIAGPVLLAAEGTTYL